MSLFTDVKYLNQIGHRLEQFKRKGDYLYNCRCPVCGDSQTNRKKTRGYFYRKSNDLFYKCHNCDASQHFGTFLKNFDNQIYKAYALERYADGENRRPHASPEFKFEAPVFQPPPESTLLDDLMTRVDKLESDSEVRKFCRQRQIPEDQLSRLYVIDDIKRIEVVHERYRNTIQTHEPRLVIPFKNTQGELIGVSCRGMRDEALRYITVRINETEPLVFGLELLDKKRPVYVCEGPLDSLFLSNSIAVGGTGFGKLGSLGLDPNTTTVIIDNQPRNAEVCKVLERIIREGYRVLIWPDYTSAKDINELVLQGIMVDNLIDANTYQGLTAQLKFNAWRKI
jgi:hypothetical protein